MAGFQQIVEVDPTGQPPEQSCSNCQFYFAAASPPQYVGKAGECRVSEPWPGDAPWGRFPLLRADQWCGKWKAAV